MLALIVIITELFPTKKYNRKIRNTVYENNDGYVFTFIIIIVFRGYFT